MTKQEAHTWINSAEPNKSIIYYTGHLAENRDKVEIRELANTFRIAAQENKIELFQKKIKKGDQSKQPIYEYIARKLKNERSIFKNI